MTYRQSAARTSLAAPDAVTGKPLETGATRMAIERTSLRGFRPDMRRPVASRVAVVSRVTRHVSVNKPAVVAGPSATMTNERKDVRGNW